MGKGGREGMEGRGGILPFLPFLPFHNPPAPLWNNPLPPLLRGRGIVN